MKKWICKIKKIICSNKGESLIETIMSMLLFIIFMLIVSTMINVSLGITRSSTQNAKQIQENVNLIMRYEYSGNPINITFSNEEFGIRVTHSTKLNNKDSIIAFTPEGVGEP